jgi:hypothetical protein
VLKIVFLEPGAVSAASPNLAVAFVTSNRLLVGCEAISAVIPGHRRAD